MFRYGRRVYFNTTGKIIAQMGEVETNVENYYEDNDPREWHPDLAGEEGVEMQQFEWGEHALEFSTRKLARMDTRTRQPVFEKWSESEVDALPVMQKTPLEREVERLHAADLHNKEMINGLGEMLITLTNDSQA
ncbi:hypothetical protein B9G55_18860 [Saccharibacillus sp. O16]|nr:hypothetical protein B9G55_18860 [Saccharibacillus sp. O16]